ncbi:hypothetical protein DH2020_010709 [Rehmannia glutinosa]|uniref:Peptidase A1 domain-containing protein n=1 Tax=Rehmannia glutinosa TaxID=99300 RepID=A0ABR0XBF8_REHGL
MDSGRCLLWVLLLLLLIQLICAVNGNVVFEVHHKYGGRSKGKALLGALRAHDSRRHGRMLAAIDFQLGGDGSPTNAAYVFTSIIVLICFPNGIGFNNLLAMLMIHLKQYDLTASSTGKTITCDQDFCDAVFDGANSNCKAGMNCQYSVSYGDGSRTEDTLCSAKQSGELGSSSEAVDGIIGFGQANTSILSQLALSGKVKKVFSHCLDGNKGGGIFAIGEVVQPKVNRTPLVANAQHYNVILKVVEVGGQFLNLPTDVFDTGSSRGTIIDSGTTLAYLPSEVYQQLMDRMMVRQPNMETHIVEQQFRCLWYSGNNPSVDSSEISPELDLLDNEYCIGWQNSGLQTKDGKEITLLGGSSSIKVRDEATGHAYAVSAHDISSSAFSPSKVNVLSILLFIAALRKLIA